MKVDKWKIYLNDCYICTVEAETEEAAARIAEDNQRFFYAKQTAIDHGQRAEVRIYHDAWHF